MTVKIPDDCDLKKIAESGQCFRWRELENGGYRIPAGGRCLSIKPTAEMNAYEVDCTRDEWSGFWYDYFDLGRSYAGIRAKIEQKKDPYLYAAAEAGKGIRILNQDPWETLITFIISQRKSIPAIRNCVEKLCIEAKIVQSRRNNNGEADEADVAMTNRKRTDKASDAWNEVSQNRGREEIFAFPDPQELAALSHDELASCGLGYRTDYIAKTAHLAAEGTLNFGILQKLDDDELMKKLMSLPGVGVKVASCTMLFGYHRLNLFPKDVWINRVLQEHYPEGFPFERYRPYCGVMQQYLFYYRRKEK